MNNINLYLLKYELHGKMGYGKGVAVISASSIKEAQSTLKAQGSYNGYLNAYDISETIELATKSNYDVSTIITENNLTQSDIV